jgi:hypothetical protein
MIFCVAKAKRPDQVIAFYDKYLESVWNDNYYKGIDIKYEEGVGIPKFFFEDEYARFEYFDKDSSYKKYNLWFKLFLYHFWIDDVIVKTELKSFFTAQQINHALLINYEAEDRNGEYHVYEYAKGELLKLYEPKQIEEVHKKLLGGPDLLHVLYVVLTSVKPRKKWWLF